MTAVADADSLDVLGVPTPRLHAPLAGPAVSTAGSALTDLAAGIFVWRATESTLAVALTLMVTALPGLVVGLLAGVYVDRHDRQRIMMGTCLIQAVVVAFIAIVIGSTRSRCRPSSSSCCSTPG